MKKVIPDFKSSHITFGGTGRAGHYPDILMPSDTWQSEVKNLYMGENTQFWLKLKVPADARAGTYKGFVTFKARGVETKIPIEVEVYDFALPEKSPLKVTACVDGRLISRVFKFEDYKNFYRDLIVPYQQTGVDPIYPKPKIQVVDGKVTVDTKQWEKMVGYCLDELGMNHFFFPARPTRLGGNIYNWSNSGKAKNNEWFGIKLCDSNYNLTPEFKKAFTVYLKKTLPILKKNGWFEKMYMPSLDEPRCYEDYQLISNWCDFIHSVDPEINIFITSRYPLDTDIQEDKIVGKIKYWCPNNSWDEEFWKKRKKEGDEFSFYTNWLLYSPDWPIVNPRLLGWIAWQIDSVGYLNYNITEGFPRYLVYQKGIKMFASGQLLYNAQLEPRLYPSIRWEMEREGFEDFMYLWVLRNNLAEVKARGITADVVKEAERFLETVTVKILPNGPFMKGKTWESTEPFYTNSNQTVVEVRNNTAELIEKLVKVRAKDEAEFDFP
jgi:hypothetical protein